MDHLPETGLRVAPVLRQFIDTEALPGTGLDAAAFWSGLAGLVARFAPRNQALLERRDALAAQIDAWHKANPGRPIDQDAYAAYLGRIGYLVPEPPEFAVSTANVDPEIASIAGPQLVVPVNNARYALNAGNARWGSLYDALYGTAWRAAVATTRCAAPPWWPAPANSWTSPRRWCMPAMPMWWPTPCVGAGWKPR
jgi:malate synthase